MEVGALQEFIRRRQIPLLIAGVLVIGAAVFAAYLIWFRQTYAVLFTDLRTLDAATIVTELDKRKIPYRLRDGGTTILTPSELVDSTRLAVTSQALPLKGVVGFEIFSKSDMGLTEFAQRINYRRALQGEIERTIMSLEAVESARVNLSLSEPTVFREDRRPSKASVTIIPRAGHQLSPQSVLGVRRLVAAAAADLEPADVVVLDAQGAGLGDMDPAEAPPPPPIVQAQTGIEAYYAGRVRLALQGRLSTEPTSVKVTVGAPTVISGSTGDPYAEWSPVTRRFPLLVDVVIAPSLSAPTQTEVELATKAAIGSEEDAGDQITVTYAGPAPRASVGSVPPAQRAPSETALQTPATPPSLSAPSLFWLALSAPVLLGLLFLAAALHRRALRPGRMSQRQREALIQRFNDVLQPGAADATARS